MNKELEDNLRLQIKILKEQTELYKQQIQLYENISQTKNELENGVGNSGTNEPDFFWGVTNVQQLPKSEDGSTMEQGERAI